MVQLVYAVIDDKEPLERLVAELRRAEQQLSVSVWSERPWYLEDGTTDEARLLQLVEKTWLAPPDRTVHAEDPDDAVHRFLDTTCMLLLGEDFCNEHVFVIPRLGLHSMTWRHWAKVVDRWAVSTFEQRVRNPHGYVDFYMSRDGRPWSFVEDYNRFLDTWSRSINLKTISLFREGAPR